MGHKPLNVTSEEKEKLAILPRRPKTAQAIAMRDVASGVTISNCYRRHRHQELLSVTFAKRRTVNLPSVF
jgi:hypothetical protein